MQNSPIARGVKQPLTRETERDIADGDLQAIIEEAHRRARRRRLKVLAGIAAVLAVLGLGWWGIGGDPLGGSDPDPASPAGGVAGKGVHSGNPCPPQPVPVVHKSGSRPGPVEYRTHVPMCQLTYSADLPAGWIQRGRTDTQPPKFKTSFGVMGGTMPRGVTFTTAAAHTGIGPRWPFYLPDHSDLAIHIVPEGPKQGRAEPDRALTSSDFHPLGGSGRNPATGRRELYRSGWRFQFDARAGGEPVDQRTLQQANAVIDSITVDKKLIP